MSTDRGCPAGRRSGPALRHFLPPVHLHLTLLTQGIGLSTSNLGGNVARARVADIIGYGQWVLDSQLIPYRLAIVGATPPNCALANASVQAGFGQELALTVFDPSGPPITAS